MPVRRAGPNPTTRKVGQLFNARLKLLLSQQLDTARSMKPLILGHTGPADGFAPKLKRYSATLTQTEVGYFLRVWHL